MKKNKIFHLFIIFSAYLFSCGKSKFLGVKPDDRFITPTSINDFQKILDNNEIMNIGVIPSFGETRTNDYFLTELPTDATLGASFRSLYVWQDEDIYKIKHLDWDFPYRSILYANIVLKGLKEINPNSVEKKSYDNVKGSALFYRAEKMFHLAQIFAQPYESGKLNPFGLPLRQSTDMNEKIVRSSVGDTYRFILNDLQSSVELLPDKPLEGYRTRPSKAAAYGLLARVYLTMSKYDSARYYSDKYLSINPQLMDFNNDPFVDRLSSNPIMQFNSEVTYHSTLIQSTFTISLFFSPGYFRVDSTLFSLYKEGDLRREIFFRPETIGYSFVGSYDGSGLLFSGIATDEIYFINAEANARLGDLGAAIKWLNELMIKRWKTDSWVPFLASDKDEALSMILEERRKELLFRGLRWPDLRRLNLEGANILLKRELEGSTYELLPNDKKYTFLIPPDVIGFYSDMLQNPR